MTILELASICHTANKALCESIGDNSQPEWSNAPEWQRESAVKGMEFVLANPEAPESANHESWLAVKEADGWQYGPVKDAEKKEHPCMVPFEQLPKEQQAKDALFRAVALALAPLVQLQTHSP